MCWLHTVASNRYDSFDDARHTCMYYTITGHTRRTNAWSVVKCKVQPCSVSGWHHTVYVVAYRTDVKAPSSRYCSVCVCKTDSCEHKLVLPSTVRIVLVGLSDVVVRHSAELFLFCLAGYRTLRRAALLAITRPSSVSSSMRRWRSNNGWLG